MHKIGVSAALEFTIAALESAGVDADSARITAKSLVAANQSGTHSHGLMRLPLYVRAIESGGIKAKPSMKWLKNSGAVALLDADSGLGQVAMHTAVEKARQLAESHGVAAVAVQNSSHYGAGAFWAQKISDAGYISIITSSTGPVVAPFGGAEKVLGTNPLTVSVPMGSEDEFLADFATSAGAYGKVVAHHNSGEPLPPGWAVDRHGEPTEDPQKAMEGALLPFGGHKGSSLSVALEALSVILSGASFAYETEDIWENSSSRMNLGHTVIVLNPESFMGLEHVRNRTSSLLTTVRRSGRSRVYGPGELEKEVREQNIHNVRIPEPDFAALLSLQKERSLPVILNKS